MKVDDTARQRRVGFIIGAALLLAGISMPAQQRVTETRDPTQAQDEDFAKLVKEWTTQPVFHQPAGRSPAEGGGHPDAQGRARAITSARRGS